MKHTYGVENLIVRSWGEGASLYMGSFCSIADRVEILLGGNHRTDWITTYPFGHINQHIFDWHGQGHPSTKGDVVIGNDVWLGSQCTILSGVKVGNGAVIAAKSVVHKDVPDYCIVAGNPAKIIKKRFTYEQIEALNANPWWELPDEEIQELLPLLCSGKIDDFIAKISKPR